MNTLPKQMTGRLLSYLLIFVTLMLLIACEGGGKGSLATPTPHPSLGGMRTYTDTNYTIRYPADWKAVQINWNVMVFFIPSGLYTMSISYKLNTDGTSTPDDMAKAGLLVLRHPYPVPLPTTIRFAGHVWNQYVATSNESVEGKSMQVELVSLATQVVQASGPVIYLIVYDAPASTFEQAAKQYFTPMLQSFRFTVQ